MKNKSFSYNLIIYFFAILVFLTMFFPLYGLILTSIQPENVIRSKNITFFPSSIVLYHFKEVLNPNHISQIYEGMRNSFIVSILTGILSILLAFPAAYSLSRLKFPGKNLILISMISVYFLPTILFIIPMFIFLVSYNLNDTILKSCGALYSIYFTFCCLDT
jgi:ABC-type sugar transport system, permease component